MNEFMEQYWSFYHAGVTIFLFAGLTLLIKLVFFKRKRRKKEPHLKFKHWNNALKMILNDWKTNCMLLLFYLKKQLSCLI